MMSTYNQASLQLSILESLLRLVRTKLNQRLWGPDTECATVRSFTALKLKRNALNTSQDPSMLPHSGHILQHPPPHPPNSHECEDQCEWNVFV
ncbi:hypothetical protein F7725_004330 [Dissostichus mawsoni]|uniref:Uncharacterized protein n=1 Tax=Dissostichus mawsoni TaxID=36200 RepID=A0A7J5XID8_DISMA|nr:hypothetical protein F7725_004330 [Dissostichus mawsoni]